MWLLWYLHTSPEVFGGRPVWGAVSRRQRIKPPLNGPEADIPLGCLDWHRDTLRLKADGLDAAAAAPSGSSRRR